MIILGIDPGSNITGFGIVEAGEGKDRLLESGVIRVGKPDKDTGMAPQHALRLKSIHEAVTELIEEFKPDLCAVEMPIYGKNPQSMLKLGRAQAAAMLAALNRQIPVTEYTPKEIKKAVTGNGNASKEQVRFMVETMLQMRQGMSITLDASDALAVALCHIHRGATRSTATYKNWEAFARSNPGRIK
ncbi:MAG: crossover junction endodeoxyribonuclease RuvC [Bacteroidetes bacterium]|nr:crossover junction endodeoxyribonuclease RuvC [Bacteroidota bacterium]